MLSLRHKWRASHSMVHDHDGELPNWMLLALTFGWGWRSEQHTGSLRLSQVAQLISPSGMPPPVTSAWTIEDKGSVETAAALHLLPPLPPHPHPHPLLRTYLYPHV